MDSRLFIGFLNGVNFVHKILERRPRKYFMTQMMSSPGDFEKQLYFHTLMLLEECMYTKLVPAVKNYSSGL